MAISDQIGSAASTTELVGTVDLLIGVAGPANAEELRCRAERAFPSLIASGVLRIAVASPMASPAEAENTLAPSDSGLQYLNYAARLPRQRLCCRGSQLRPLIARLLVLRKAGGREPA